MCVCMYDFLYSGTYILGLPYYLSLMYCWLLQLLAALLFQMSVTFDPLSCLAVPLPKKMKVLPVILVRRDSDIPPVKVGWYRCV